MSEDFEDYLRIFVPKDISMEGDWDFDGYLGAIERGLEAARTGKDGEVYQMTVDVPATLDLQALNLFFETIATAAHDFEEDWPDRTWAVFVAGGVLSDDHSAEAAFARVNEENEELYKLLHTLYRSVIWSDTDLTQEQRELFTKAYRWAERQAGQ